MALCFTFSVAEMADSRELAGAPMVLSARRVWLVADVRLDREHLATNRRAAGPLQGSSQLVHQAGGIDDSPVFAQCAVVDTEVVADVDWLASGRYAHELASSSPGELRQDEHLVTFGDHVVDLHTGLVDANPTPPTDASC